MNQEPTFVDAFAIANAPALQSDVIAEALRLAPQEFHRLRNSQGGPQKIESSVRGKGPFGVKLWSVNDALRLAILLRASRVLRLAPDERFVLWNAIDDETLRAGLTATTGQRRAFLGFEQANDAKRVHLWVTPEGIAEALLRSEAITVLDLGRLLGEFVRELGFVVERRKRERPSAHPETEPEARPEAKA